MMDLVAEIIGGLLLVVGAFFFLVGAIGMNRMPELFTRIHAASLADTTGAVLMLVGLFFYGGLSLVTVKLVLLVLFLLLMGPTATHALAAAALHAGVKPLGAPKEAAPAKVKSGGRKPRPAKAKGRRG